VVPRAEVEEAAGEPVAEPAAAVAHAEAAAGVVPHAEEVGAEVAVPPASEAVAGERQAVRELRAAGRPSAVAPSSRLRLAPARRSAVTMRFAPAPRRLRIASP
jgi:hypothetical protein